VIGEVAPFRAAPAVPAREAESRRPVLPHETVFAAPAAVGSVAPAEKGSSAGGQQVRQAALEGGVAGRLLQAWQHRQRTRGSVASVACAYGQPPREARREHSRCQAAAAEEAIVFFQQREGAGPTRGTRQI